MLGGTDVGCAEACTNAHSGVCVVMCQTAAGSKQSNAIVQIAAERSRMVSTSPIPEVYTSAGSEKMTREGLSNNRLINVLSQLRKNMWDFFFSPPSSN